VLTKNALILYGISSTIGAGIFALTGLAVKLTGPAMIISFLLAGALCLMTA
jgi:basic amino acid/polyamine antiporter, APA family